MICKHCGNDEPVCFDELDYCNQCTSDWYTQQRAELEMEELQAEDLSPFLPIDSGCGRVQ